MTAEIIEEEVEMLLDNLYYGTRQDEHDYIYDEILFFKRRLLEKVKEEVSK